jgi:phospholipid/cholesterol/gamma-HCH transport system permease protein
VRGVEFSEQIGTDGKPERVLAGRWTLRAIASAGPEWRARLRNSARQPGLHWDCRDIEALDSAGALLLWNTWGRRFPEHLRIDPEHQRIFERVADAGQAERALPRPPYAWLELLGLTSLALLRHLRAFVTLLGQLVFDALHVLRHPAELPAREISANIYKSGVRAMPVTALVGFLIGVVLSYLSALQLSQFGADMFIVNILGLGIIRELGPVLVAVLVAGRSGSAMTAQLGVMRVTEEIEALAAMGVPRSQRLIFPKVLALAIVMPLLVLWTSAIALLGGMVAANLQLDIGYGFFIETLPKAVPVANLWIGQIGRASCRERVS